MKITVCETINHYHQVELNDELDPEEVVKKAKEILSMCESGWEAIHQILMSYEQEFGFDYKVEPDYCGYKTESIEIEDVEEEY